MADAATDDFEADKNLPRYGQIRQVIAHKQAGGAAEGDVEQLDQLIKDNEVRVPEPKEVKDIPLAAVMPIGEQVIRNEGMPANLPTDKKIVEFVVMREDFMPNEAGVIKGLNFLTA